jgi:hypothetical protein
MAKLRCALVFCVHSLVITIQVESMQEGKLTVKANMHGET